MIIKKLIDYSDTMNNKNISSFEIIKHNNFSWSYVYIINNKKRDIHAVSVRELKRKVLSRNLPWDDENYPENNIIESTYDSDKAVHIPYKKSNEQYTDETYDYEKSGSFGNWVPSMKKWNRDKRNKY